MTELSVDDLLFQHAGQIFSFFLSFFVIAQLWFAQHNIVRTVVVQDRIVTRCLMAWALTIVVLPVPTALVSGSHEGDKTEVLYIGTMALSSLALTIAAWRVASHSRDPGRRSPAQPGRLDHHVRDHGARDGAVVAHPWRRLPSATAPAAQPDAYPP